MSTRTIVDHVFGQFHNLNLLALIQDLRQGRTARGDWSQGRGLCPVAHGVSNGEAVQLLKYASQACDVNRVCYVAARELRVPPVTLQQFITLWDSNWLGSHWLLESLKEILAERQADADAIQEILEPPRPTCENCKMAGVYGNRTHLGPDFQTLRRV
jgi:hypothetical protein